MIESKKTVGVSREKEERLRRIVDDLPFPVAIYNDMGIFLAINHAWSELSGYPPQLIPTLEAWICLANRKRREAVRELITVNFRLETMTHKGEFPIYTASGEERTWDFYAGPIGKDHEGRRLVLNAAMDVTGRSRKGKNLRESEEALAKAHRQKEQFLAALSSELVVLTGVWEGWEARPSH